MGEDTFSSINYLSFDKFVLDVNKRDLNFVDI